MEIEVAYRNAEIHDLDCVVALHAANFRQNNPGKEDGGSFPESFLSEALPIELNRFWSEKLRHPSPDQLIKVAVQDSKLLGFICVIGKTKDGSLIDNLHVSKEARTVGVGSRLMQQAVEWLKEKYPQTPVYLTVLEANNIARQFYEKRGARLKEILDMNSYGETGVKNCVYTWRSPDQMI